MTRMTWPARLGPALGPGVLMFAISLVGAGHPVLSWDEIATADVASRTPAQIWHMMHQIDGVFGPYYLLEHFWTSVVGSTELDLRLPSMVAMAGAVALAGELGRRFFGPLVGTVAGVLLCLMPSTSQYAAEARPYAFACFFALLSLLLLHLAVERPGVGRWVAYGIAVLFLGLAHVIALTTLAAHVVVIRRHRDRRTVLAWSLAAGLALLALAPLFRLGILERNAQLSWVPPLEVGSVWNFPGLVVGSVPGGWLLLGLAAFALWRPIRHLGEITVLALAPIVVVAAVSLVVSPYWVPRYLLVVLAPLALLAAVGLLQPSPAPAEAALPAGRPARRVLVLRVATVLALLAFAVHPAERAVRGADAKSGSDYRTAAMIIRQEQLPGDAIAYPAVSRAMRSGLDYYLRNDPRQPRDVLLDRSAAAVGRLFAQEYRPTRARLRGVARLWLVVSGIYADPLTARPDLRPIVRVHFRRDRIWYLHKETLALYVRLAGLSPAVPVAATRK